MRPRSVIGQTMLARAFGALSPEAQKLFAVLAALAPNRIGIFQPPADRLARLFGDWRQLLAELGQPGSGGWPWVAAEQDWVWVVAAARELLRLSPSVAGAAVRSELEKLPPDLGLRARFLERYPTLRPDHDPVRQWVERFYAEYRSITGWPSPDAPTDGRIHPRDQRAAKQLARLVASGQYSEEEVISRLQGWLRGQYFVAPGQSLASFVAVLGRLIPASRRESTTEESGPCSNFANCQMFGGSTDETCRERGCSLWHPPETRRSGAGPTHISRSPVRLPQPPKNGRSFLVWPASVTRSTKRTAGGPTVSAIPNTDTNPKEEKCPGQQKTL